MSQVTPSGQEAIPAPRGVRNSATRRVASTVGVFAGLLGLEHGIGETLQGNGAPGSVLINAIGPRHWNPSQGYITQIQLCGQGQLYRNGKFE